MTTDAWQKYKRQVQIRDARADFVLAMRLNGFTFKEIGGAIGVGVQRARELYIRAARKVNHHRRLKGLPAKFPELVYQWEK